MNELLKESEELLLNDVIQIFLREIKTNYYRGVNVYYINKDFKKIINNLPKSVMTRYGGVKHFKGIHDIIKFEMFYFKTSDAIKSTINNLNPSQCKTVKQQVEYCLDWFIKDIFRSNPIKKDICKIIIEKLEEDGKL